MVDLSKIHYPADIKGILMDELTELSGKLRRTLLKNRRHTADTPNRKVNFRDLFKR